eukprot:61678-Chlamydomonas_euryale.AAC.1
MSRSLFPASQPASMDHPPAPPPLTTQQPASSNPRLRLAHRYCTIVAAWSASSFTAPNCHRCNAAAARGCASSAYLPILEGAGWSSRT